MIGISFFIRMICFVATMLQSLNFLDSLTTGGNISFSTPHHHIMHKLRKDYRIIFARQT